MKDYRSYWCRNCNANYSSTSIPTNCHYCGGLEFRGENFLQRFESRMDSHPVTQIVMDVTITMILMLAPFLAGFVNILIVHWIVSLLLES